MSRTTPGGAKNVCLRGAGVDLPECQERRREKHRSTKKSVFFFEGVAGLWLATLSPKGGGLKGGREGGRGVKPLPGETPEALPAAYCISKVFVIESGEIMYDKVFVSPRPPPEGPGKHHQNSTKRTNKRGRKSETVAGKEKKKARNFGPPTPPGPHPSGPPPKRKKGQMRSGQIRSNKIGQIRPNKVGQMRPNKDGQIRFGQIWPWPLNQPPFGLKGGLNQTPFGLKGGKMKTKPVRVHFGLLPPPPGAPGGFGLKRGV